MSVYAVTKKTRDQTRRRKLHQQKILGLVLIVISALVVCVAATGTTPEERDITAVLVTAPLGLYLMFTKNIVIY